MSVHVSRANRAVVVPLTPTMKNMFPDAKPLPDGRGVIEHGLREHVILSRIGVKTPNPMLMYYEWPGSNQPFHVQRSTCALLTTNQRAYVLNDMGTGKTKAALWAWDYLYTLGLAGKLLVTAPLSTLNFVWMSEIFDTLPHRKGVVLYGDKETRIERLNDQTADIYIINHDGIKVVYDELAKAKHIDTLLIDELASFRNDNDRSKTLRKLADRMEWVWGMTGSPMPNEPPDVWMQCRIITPHTVPKYKKGAKEMLMTKINKFKWLPKPNAIETAYNFMQPSVRYTLEDVTELPDFIERTINIPLIGEQKRVYELVAKHFQAMAQMKKITAQNAGAAMNKLLQISTGWVYAEDETVNLTPNGSHRMDIVREIINQARHKVIVFAPFRHALAGISQLLTGSDPAHPEVDHAMVHGEVHDRDRIFNAFQNTEQYKVLVAHPQCMAHGLTLTAANVIVWFAPITSLEIYSQANARIRRVGQKAKQILLHIQSTPVERRIYKLLQNKARLQDELLTLVENASQPVEDTP